jgi:hypothetical protein
MRSVFNDRPKESKTYAVKSSPTVLTNSRKVQCVFPWLNGIKIFAFWRKRFFRVLLRICAVDGKDVDIWFKNFDESIELQLGNKAM